jgi:hypothetical protein
MNIGYAHYLTVLFQIILFARLCDYLYAMHYK